MTEYTIFPENCRDPKTASDFAEWAVLHSEFKRMALGHLPTSQAGLAMIIETLSEKCESFQYLVEMLEIKLEHIRNNNDDIRKKAREADAIPSLQKIIADQAARIAELERDLVIARKINFPE